MVLSYWCFKVSLKEEKILLEAKEQQLDKNQAIK